MVSTDGTCASPPTPTTVRWVRISGWVLQIWGIPRQMVDCNQRSMFRASRRMGHALLHQLQPRSAAQVAVRRIWHKLDCHGRRHLLTYRGTSIIENCHPTLGLSKGPRQRQRPGWDMRFTTNSSHGPLGSSFWTDSSNMGETALVSRLQSAFHVSGLAQAPRMGYALHHELKLRS